MSVTFQRLSSQDEKILKAVFEDHPKPFVINSEHWEGWGIDRRRCGNIVRGLIEVGFLQDVNPSCSTSFARVVALTEKGLSYCKSRWLELSETN